VSASIFTTNVFPWITTSGNDINGSNIGMGLQDKKRLPHGHHPYFRYFNKLIYRILQSSLDSLRRIG